MTPGAPAAEISEVTRRSNAFVASHRGAAEDLGRRLADQIQDPEGFAETLRTGLRRLGDPEVVEGQHFIAPGLGPTFGVRQPLLDALARAFSRATRDDRPTPLLFLADRLFRESELESRWVAFGLLHRTVTHEPERTWQLLRRAAREAGDWITVDNLAHPCARGILAEPYRWAELEQLVFSPSRWERRLVGSTIATVPFESTDAGRAPEVAARALEILATLIGDDEPDVQKALSWAYRNLAAIDRDAVTAALTAETETAAVTGDGYRAWVIRDSLPQLDPGVATGLRARLEGIRRRSGSPPTSTASGLAARFGALPDPATHPEPPLG